MSVKLPGLIKSLIFSWAVFFTIGSFAQPGLSRTFRLEEENKQVQVNVIFKNNTGYIFAGTNNGLYKFDGAKFYPINFKNKAYTDTVTAIFQDNEQVYWIGFKSGRLANIINGILTYLNFEEGSPREKITSFIQDDENNIWFSTNGEGIYYLKNKRLFLINKENGLSDENVSSLAKAGNGDILAATDQGLNCIQVNNKNNIFVVGPAQGLPDYIVSSIIHAGVNTFWIGMQDNGFCFYDHTIKKITVPKITEWNYGQINNLLLAQNYLWIATQNHGLLKYKINNEGMDITEVIPKQSINSLLEDNQGNIWSSNSETGLIRTPGIAIKILPLPQGSVFDHIHTLLADKNGNLWVTNNKNELIINSLLRDKHQSQLIRLKGINEKTDITSLYQDFYNNIWIGTVGKGIYVMDPQTYKYRLFDENALFTNATILSITGKGKSVFVSTLQGSMAIELTGENKNIQNPYPFANFNNLNTSLNYSYYIYKDSKDRVWFATDGRGISVIDNAQFTNYNSREQILDDRVYSITEDHKGNIWFSTASAGIYKFDGTSFKNYSALQGLSNLNISAVKTDKNGNIIIIHKKGFDILDPLSNKISYINNNTGINSLNVEDLGAVAQDTAGNIYVSSQEGIVVYSPKTNIIHQPKTIIESVQLFLNVLNESASRIFSHENNNFTFNYTGLYYTDPEQVYYQYKLEGFDTSWILTKDRSKTFPKLAPGKYNFRIQSSLNKNFTNVDEASYSFVIKQAFYKRWWFIIPTLILLSILLYWYIRNREAGLKKMERLQQEKIQFRFEVLRNQVNPHFLFNSFNTLISTIEDDPKLAVEYVEQLSDFFRNIVNYRDKDIISLKEEIELLYTYYFLQKKRYGNNLQLVIMISDDEKMKNSIPPLSLQLLLENAIKHNAITKEDPLMVTIEIIGNEYLSVINNINKRISKESGSGMGLQNIINRYHLLTNKKVTVTDTKNHFTVSLPLIKMHHA